MSERSKQNGLSALITALGIGLLLFCRHDALTSGTYSLKLLFLAAVLVVWGPMSFVLNMRDPRTTQRAISRLTRTSAEPRQSVATALAVLVIGVVIVGGVDYLFDVWIEGDLQACRVAGTCATTGGAPKSVL